MRATRARADQLEKEYLNVKNQIELLRQERDSLRSGVGPTANNYGFVDDLDGFFI